MPYTFEEGFNDIAECFALYHDMGVRETKEYFERVGIIPFMKEYYSGLAYEDDLRLVAWLRREIADLGQPLPEQRHFETLPYVEEPPIP